MLSLLFAFSLNIWFLGGSTVSIVVLAPILILLNKDVGVFQDLNENNKYLPVGAVIYVTLFGSILFELLVRNGLQMLGWVIFSKSTFSALKNFVLLSLTLTPSFYTIRFLYNQKTESWYFWSLIGPPAILSLLLTDLVEIQVLSILAVASGVFQVYYGWDLQNRAKQIL